LNAGRRCGTRNDVSPSEYPELDPRFDRCFEAMNRQFQPVRGDIGELRDELAGFRSDMLRGFDETHRRLERLEQGAQVMAEIVRRIEALLTDGKPWLC
jgi:hypothetical protein